MEKFVKKVYLSDAERDQILLSKALGCRWHEWDVIMDCEARAKGPNIKRKLRDMAIHCYFVEMVKEGYINRNATGYTNATPDNCCP